jgi:hypothetical protein
LNRIIRLHIRHLSPAETARKVIRGHGEERPAGLLELLAGFDPPKVRKWIDRGAGQPVSRSVT